MRKYGKEIKRLSENVLEESGNVEIVENVYEMLDEEEKKAIERIRAGNRKKYSAYIRDVTREVGLSKGEGDLTIAEEAAITAWKNAKTPKDLVTMMEAAGEKDKAEVKVSVTFEDLVVGAKKSW